MSIDVDHDQPADRGETVVSVELTKDEAVAVIGAINFAAQADSSLLRSEPTISGYKAVQAGLRDYFERVRDHG